MRYLPCVLFFITLGCAHEATTTPRHLEEMLKGSAQQSREVLAWLKTCAKTCVEPDRDIADDLALGYDTLFQVSAKNPTSSQLSNEEKAQVIVGQGHIRSGFLQVLAKKDNRDLLATAYREMSAPGSVYEGPDAELDQAVQDAITRLKKNPKTLATAWYLTAISQPIRADDFFPAIAAYRSCLQVDAKDPDCQRNYDELVQYYQRPRCRKPNFVDGLTVLPATSHPLASYPRTYLPPSAKGAAAQAPVYLSKKPLLHGQDLLEATVESPTAERNEILLSLKTFSVPRLSHFIELEKSGPEDSRAEFFTLMVQGQLLSATPITADLEEGQLRLRFKTSDEAKTVFNKICLKTVSEKLPSELRF